MRIWDNGKWIDADDCQYDTPAFQFGFGLFETILIRDGKPLNLRDHVLRLQGSISALEPSNAKEPDYARLEAMAAEACAHNGAGPGVLKIIARREQRHWSVVLLSRSYTYSKGNYEKGCAIRQAAGIRNDKSLLVCHKSLNYLENYLERINARQQGYDDAYYLNSQGGVTECTAANIFVLVKGKLLTPPADAGLLPGIMRGRLLLESSRLGIAVLERPIAQDLLLQADTVFITNAVCGALPVAVIDGVARKFDAALIGRINKLLEREL